MDLSYNRIGKLDGLEDLRNLESLNLSRNVLTDGAAIQELTKCPKLHTVDLTHNQLSGEDVLVQLSRISTLLTLSIAGNDVTREQSFRKKMITMVGITRPCHNYTSNFFFLSMNEYYRYPVSNT